MQLPAAVKGTHVALLSVFLAQKPDTVISQIRIIYAHSPILASNDMGPCNMRPCL